MCRISSIADDWVTKGCHIHVGEVELAMRPDHTGGIVFKKVYESTSDVDSVRAAKQAMQLLNDIRRRRRFHGILLRARTFLQGQTGRLAELAIARSGELTFLIHALRKMGI